MNTNDLIRTLQDAEIANGGQPLTMAMEIDLDVLNLRDDDGNRIGSVGAGVTTVGTESGKVWLSGVVASGC